MLLSTARLFLDSDGGVVCDPSLLSAAAVLSLLAEEAVDSVFAQNAEVTVLQTGFGDGALFLSTVAKWRGCRAGSGRLSFVAVEPRPFCRADVEWLHSGGCAGGPFGGEDAVSLRTQWPLQVPGIHRMEFEGGRVVLTLFFGGWERALSEIQASVDLFFMTGESESGVALPVRELARLAVSGATLVGENVRESTKLHLNQSGFLLTCNDAEKGGEGARVWRFRGAKRRMGSHWASAERGAAIVVGAGLAGTSVAAQMAGRGVSVTLVERHGEVAQEASGNLAGVMAPMISKDDGLAARLSRACFLALRRELRGYEGTAFPVKWSECGVVQFAKDAKEEGVFAAMKAAQHFPADYLRFMTRETVVAELQLEAPASACFFPLGGWVNPPSLCQARVECSPGVRRCFGRNVSEIRREGDLWQVLDHNGGALAEAPILVLANASDAKEFSLSGHLHFKKVRGQVSHLDSAALPPFSRVLCRDGYLIPGVDGLSCLGATFDFETEDVSLRMSGHLENLGRLPGLLPGATDEWKPEELPGRVGFRSLTADRLPVVGALPDLAALLLQPQREVSLGEVPRHPGLYGLLGLGSRGLVWSGLMGEFLAAMICGEHWPIELDLARAVDPARFLVRKSRLSQSQG